MNATALGLIYTGKVNPYMKDLTLSRSVAALPFGGRYRCIDFILSNMVNSGVESVGLILQKNYHSLMDHLGAGKEWDLDRKREGLFLLPPFLTKDSTGVYRGSVDAYRACLGYIRRCPQQYAILSGSYTIFNMPFQNMMSRHITSGADITMLFSEDSMEPVVEPNHDVRIRMDEDGRVTALEIDASHPMSTHRSCDVIIIDKKLLEYLVEEAYARGESEFLRDVIIKKLSTLKVLGYRYDGFVVRLDSVDSYYRSNLALLDEKKRGDLFNAAHPIYTKVKDEVSTHYGESAHVTNSILADGCTINGTVENSILFRGVTVGKGATVRNSIVLQGAVIGKGCSVDHVIFDKRSELREGRVLTGYDTFPIIVRKNTVI